MDPNICKVQGLISSLQEYNAELKRKIEYSENHLKSLLNMLCASSHTEHGNEPSSREEAVPLQVTELRIKGECRESKKGLEVSFAEQLDLGAADSVAFPLTHESRQIPPSRVKASGPSFSGNAGKTKEASPRTVALEKKVTDFAAAQQRQVRNSALLRPLESKSYNKDTLESHSAFTNINNNNTNNNSSLHVSSIAPACLPEDCSFAAHSSAPSAHSTAVHAVHHSGTVSDSGKKVRFSSKSPQVTDFSVERFSHSQDPEVHQGQRHEMNEQENSAAKKHKPTPPHSPRSEIHLYLSTIQKMKSSLNSSQEPSAPLDRSGSSSAEKKRPRPPQGDTGKVRVAPDTPRTSSTACSPSASAPLRLTRQQQQEQEQQRQHQEFLTKPLDNGRSRDDSSMTCAVILQEELEGAASATPLATEEGAYRFTSDPQTPEAELLSSLPTSPILVKRNRKAGTEASSLKDTKTVALRTTTAKGRRKAKQKKAAGTPFPVEQSTRVDLPDTTNSVWCVEPSWTASRVVEKEERDVRLVRPPKGPSRFPAVDTDAEESALCNWGLLNIICKKTSFHHDANLEKGTTSGIVIACGPTVQFD